MNITDNMLATAARLVADEHGSDAYSAHPASGEYAPLERDQYEAEARAVIEFATPHITADVVTLLRQLAGEPELVIDGPGDRLPVDATTAMHLLARAADWLETHLKETRCPAGTAVACGSTRSLDPPDGYSDRAVTNSNSLLIGCTITACRALRRPMSCPARTPPRRMS